MQDTPTPDFALTSAELRARKEAELAERIAREGRRQPRATIDPPEGGYPARPVIWSFGWGA